MSDYLANLAARSLNLAQVIQPRSVALFEPPRVTGRRVARPDLFLETLESEHTAEMHLDSPLPSRPTTRHSAESLSDMRSPSIPLAISPLTPVQVEPQGPVRVLAPVAVLPSVARMPGQVEPSVASSLEFAEPRAVQPRDPHLIPQSETDLPTTAQTLEQTGLEVAQPARPRVQQPTAPDSATSPALKRTESISTPQVAIQTLEQTGLEVAQPARPRVQQPTAPDSATLLAPHRVEPVSRPQGALAQMPVVQPENPSLSPVISPGVAQEENTARPQALEMQTVLHSHQPAPPVIPGQIVARPYVTPAQSRAPTRPPAPVDQSISPPEPVVHVTIGRIEVRATPPARARREAQARQPALGLQEYLQRYGGKR
jgi:hypothetical protein